MADYRTTQSSVIDCRNMYFNLHDCTEYRFKTTVYIYILISLYDFPVDSFDMLADLT